jgi:hypothetical protein
MRSKEYVMSEMSQAQAPDTGAGGTDPLSGEVSEVAENLDDVDQSSSDAHTSSSGTSSSETSSNGGSGTGNSADDGLLNADVGPDRNEQSEGDLREPGDPDSASDPMPDIAGTGS